MPVGAARRRADSGQQAVLYRVCGYRRRVVQVQLLHEIRSVLFDRLVAYRQVISDLPVAVSFSNQFQDLAFPRCQRIPSWRRACSSRSIQVAVDDMFADARA